jgi:acetyl esterase/lipase
MPRNPRLLAGLLLLLASCGPSLLSTADNVVRFRAGPQRAATGLAYGENARQKLDVYVPRGSVATDKRPVVVFFYGGGWAEGARLDYAFAGRAYAARGFVTVIPDYRLVPEVRFPFFVQDGAAAVRWVRDNIARYGGDPARITVAGHSAGAQIAALLTLDKRYLEFQGVPPGTIRAAALLAGPYDFTLTGDRARAAFGEWRRPADTQPYAFARPDAPPMWLGTGSLDEVVEPRNSEVLAARLRAMGAVAEFKQYPGGSHVDMALALAKPFRGRVPVLDDSSAFLLQHSR